MQRSWVQCLVRELRFHMPKEYFFLIKKKKFQRIVSILLKKNTEYFLLSEGTWDKDGPYPSWRLWFDYTWQERFSNVQPQVLSHRSSPPCWRPATLWSQLTETNRSPMGSAMLLPPRSSGPPGVDPPEFIDTTPVSSPSPPLRPSSSFFFFCFSINPSLLPPLSSSSHLPSLPSPPPLSSPASSLSPGPKARPPPF